MISIDICEHERAQARRFRYQHAPVRAGIFDWLRELPDLMAEIDLAHDAQPAALRHGRTAGYSRQYHLPRFTGEESNNAIEQASRP